jgi:hypothetical protein
VGPVDQRQGAGAGRGAAAGAGTERAAAARKEQAGWAGCLTERAETEKEKEKLFHF